MALDPRGFPGYLFDLDGTLIDTAPDICAAVNHALHRFGYGPVQESMVRHWVGHGGLVVIEQAVAAAHADGQGTSAADGAGASTGNRAVSQGDRSPTTDGAPVAEMLNHFLDYYAAHIADASQPYPGVVDTLQALSERGARLAVVTNKRITLTRKLLAALDLTGRFDVIVGGDTTAKPKPDAGPIHFACRQIGLATADILFVGDSLTDVNASRAAGCRVVCVPDGYNHGIAVAKLGADAIIGSLRELV